MFKAWLYILIIDLSGNRVKLDEPTSGLEYTSPPAQNAGWKVYGQEALFGCIPIPLLTIV